ncbi:hypothetical protein KC361_g345 [Hortaea werneckii]|nr:hypothetical protein KC361_g345 [Hortaea werneckii]
MAHEGEKAAGDVDSDLSSEVALLCLSAAGREPHYFGPSSAVSFSRIASQTLGLKKRGDGSQRSVFSDESDNRQHTGTEKRLRFPETSKARNLSQAYFNNIHPQYPFLHRPTFKRWEEECIGAAEGGDPSSASEVALYFVLMVYAIGSLALGPIQDDSAEAYYAMALDRIAPVLDLDSMESIQSILCCAVYSIRSPIGVSVWKVSGMAMRHCIELGYHRSANRFRSTSDHLAKEMSKRCFWVAYDIDRVASFILGRPESISDDAIDVELPLDLDDENITPAGISQSLHDDSESTTTSMTGAIHGIKLRRLWSKFSTYLYPTSNRRTHEGTTSRGPSLEELRKELEDWRAAAPDLIAHHQGKPLSVFSSREWFQLAYDHSILLLYRPYITDTNGGFLEPRDDGTVNRAFEECFSRAREMCVLYRRLYQSPTIQFTWGSLHILFLGGLTYLYCLWRSRHIRQIARQADVVNTCMACTTVLIIIAERWKLATSYRDIFEVLSERIISMLCGDQTSSAPVDNARDQMESCALEQEEWPLQEWLTGLEDIGLQQGSEWNMVQELVQGVQSFQPDDPFRDTISLQGFDYDAGHSASNHDWL